MKLSPLAERLACRLKTHFNRNCDWDGLRLEVDTLTGSGFAARDLDRLTDMVKRRLPLR